MFPQKNAVSVEVRNSLRALGLRLLFGRRHVLRGICCLVLRCIYGNCLPCFRVSYHRLGLPLLGDRLHLRACRTNGKTGFLQAICVCFFCSLLGLEGVGLVCYLALLTRLRLVLAPRKRVAVVVAGCLSCRANPLVLCLLCVCYCLHDVKPNALKPHPRGCPNSYPLTDCWLIMFTACRAIGPVISSRMITGIAHYLRCRMFPTALQGA